ncbi:hypothetical protein BaRGS_00021384 [Batillaria attramentaria]|uniref:Uncharacterized protein n=1 Tax=Batillaria attramentaria TaxID=370345 RepID=A0ABD0KKC6_9CAEN
MKEENTSASGQRYGYGGRNALTSASGQRYNYDGRNGSASGHTFNYEGRNTLWPVLWVISTIMMEETPVPLSTSQL